MSIIARGLSKSFDGQPAVERISFQLGRGEIVGFLGPNGAGKSTTMKMLAAYLRPSAGMASVGGFDVQNEPESVKRITGYLPEHNPLYPEMYVREFLHFAGGLHGRSGLNARIEELIETCGLEEAAHKRIESLSKGFRQRVGLAAAILHDPEVLILDEPVSGLDPNQRVEMRRLIKRLGEEKTVLFSSHIMQEVEAICQRVIVIDRGRIVADDTLKALKLMSGTRSKTILSLENQIDTKELLKLGAVLEARHTEGTQYELIAREGADLRKELFALAVKKGWVILEMRSVEMATEDVFARLTKKAGKDVEPI